MSFVRSLPLCFAILMVHLTTALAQCPPLHGTPEQLFDAGMNALSGSAGTRNDLAAVDYFRRSAQKNYASAQVVLGYLYDAGLIVVRDPSQAANS
jgi:TPR repeat protein